MSEWRTLIYKLIADLEDKFSEVHSQPACVASVPLFNKLQCFYNWKLMLHLVLKDSRQSCQTVTLKLPSNEINHFASNLWPNQNSMDVTISVIFLILMNLLY